MVRIIALFVILSCKTSHKSVVNSIDEPHLNYLEEFKSSIDSIGEKHVIRYEKLGLTKTIERSTFSLTHAHQVIFQGLLSYSYLMQVFENRYLLISFTKGPNYANSPDLFQRDSTLIFDLEKGQIEQLKPSGIYIVQSKQSLAYAHKSGVEDSQEKSRYCLIQDINLDKHVVTMKNQQFQTVIFDTSPRMVPFIVN